MWFYIGRAQADFDGLGVSASTGTEWATFDSPERLSVPQIAPATLGG